MHVFKLLRVFADLKLLSFLAVAVLALGFPNASFATGGSGNKKVIGQVIINNYGQVFLMAKDLSNFDDPDGCGNSNYLFLTPDLVTDPLVFDRITAAILTASTSGVDAKFWLDGCTTWNGNQYPRIFSIFFNAN